MDLADRTRRWAGQAINEVGARLTTTRGRLVLWVIVLVLSASLSETGSQRLGDGGVRMAALMLAVIALELTVAAVRWLWRRFKQRRARHAVRSGR